MSLSRQGRRLEERCEKFRCRYAPTAAAHGRKVCKADYCKLSSSSIVCSMRATFAMQGSQGLLVLVCIAFM